MAAFRAAQLNHPAYIFFLCHDSLFLLRYPITVNVLADHDVTSFKDNPCFFKKDINPTLSTLRKARADILMRTVRSSSGMYTLLVCKLGKNRRLVFFWENDTLLPANGPLPVILHLRAIIDLSSRYNLFCRSANRREPVVYRIFAKFQKIYFFFLTEKGACLWPAAYIITCCLKKARGFSGKCKKVGHGRVSWQRDTAVIRLSVKHESGVNSQGISRIARQADFANCGA